MKSIKKIVHPVSSKTLVLNKLKKHPKAKLKALVKIPKSNTVLFGKYIPGQLEEKNNCGLVPVLTVGGKHQFHNDLYVTCIQHCAKCLRDRDFCLYYNFLSIPVPVQSLHIFVYDEGSVYIGQKGDGVFSRILMDTSWFNL